MLNSKKIEEIQGEDDGFEEGRIAAFARKGFAFHPHEDSRIASHSKTFPAKTGVRRIEKEAKICRCDKCISTTL